MATFLAMEEDTIPIMVFFSKIYDVQKYGSNVGMPNFSNAYRIIQIDSKNSYWTSQAVLSLTPFTDTVIV